MTTWPPKPGTPVGQPRGNDNNERLFWGTHGDIVRFTRQQAMDARRRGARDGEEKVDPAEKTAKGRLAFENMISQAAMDDMTRDLCRDWLDEYMPGAENVEPAESKRGVKFGDQEAELEPEEETGMPVPGEDADPGVEGAEHLDNAGKGIGIGDRRRGARDMAMDNAEVPDWIEAITAPARLYRP